MTNHHRHVAGPRVLLLAYSCNPRGGSELGLGWNRALQAAKFFPTWVICDDDNNRADIDNYLAKHGPIANLTFVYVKSGKWTNRLRRLPGMFYPSYNLWHRTAFKVAKELHQRIGFDVVHQLNLCGFREPGYLWKLDTPFLWGPIGGAQNYPWRFLGQAGIQGAVGETIRSLLNDWQIHFSRRVGLAARRTFRLLTANSTNAKALAPRSTAEPIVMVETGVESPAAGPHRDFHHGGPLRLLWSGVFEHRKALHLLLEALAQLPASVPYELRILGRGPLENRWRKIARRLNVDQHCHWLGWLVHPQAIEQYQWADALVFSSLRDTTGNVVLEAFAAGTPVLSLDHQGMADIVTPQCGVKLPVTNPRDVVRGIRDTLVCWHANPDELARLSRGAIERADHYSWTRQGERMAEIYREMCESRANLENRTASSDEFAEVADRRRSGRDAGDEPAAESIGAGAGAIGS